MSKQRNCYKQSKLSFEDDTKSQYMSQLLQNIMQQLIIHY